VKVRVSFAQRDELLVLIRVGLHIDTAPAAVVEVKGDAVVDGTGSAYVHVEPLRYFRESTLKDDVLPVLRVGDHHLVYAFGAHTREAILPPSCRGSTVADRRATVARLHLPGTLLPSARERPGG